MAGGLHYETGRDMPPGMVEKAAVQIARQMKVVVGTRTSERSMIVGCKHRTMDNCKKDGRPCIFSEKCVEQKEQKPMTHADLIRAMSDEVLAEKLYDIWRGEVERGNDIVINWCRPECCDHEECDREKHKACILKWLQQPAEGNQQ